MEGMNQADGRRPAKTPKTKPFSRGKEVTQGNYAFIDSQNLNLGVQKIGWKMDWKKFRKWLEEKYGVTNAYMFIGYMPENEALYELMHSHGYLVVLKRTLEIKLPGQPEEGVPADKDKEEKSLVKGNIDADLVLYAMKELPNYHKAVIVSGDGDFLSLVEYLAGKGKLLKLLTPNRRYSTLLNEFEEYIEGIDQHRRELAYHDRFKRSDYRKQ